MWLSSEDPTPFTQRSSRRSSRHSSSLPDQTPPSRRRLVAFLLGLVVLIVAVAWGLEYFLIDREGAPLADAYQVKVLADGEERASFTVPELEALGVHTIVVIGKPEEGPRLLDVVHAAGIKEFDRLIINGVAARDDGYLELTAEEIDDRVLLDIANRGTVKVVGPDIPWEARVRDVLEIDARGAVE